MSDAVVVTGTSYNHDLDSRIERSGFVHSQMTCISIYGVDDDDDDEEVTISPPGFGIGGDHRRSGVVEDDSTSSTSSIGKNSDEEESSLRRCSDGSDDDEEVQSGYTGGGGGLNNLEALEEVLPMKRSISQFYAGKSKSFTSLGDVVCCSSIKDIVKPENAFTRKRKNLLAYRNIWDKNHNGIRRSNSSGILKRHSNSNSNSRSNLALAASNLALAASMACTESSRNSSDDSNSNSPSHSHCLPPLPPQTKRYPRNDLPSPPLQQKFSSWRSFSLSDLQGVAAIQSISGQKDQ